MWRTAFGDQVGDEALEEVWVAGGLGGLERGGGPESLVLVAPEDLAGGGGAVDGFAGEACAFGSGEGKQSLEQAFLSPAGHYDLLAHPSQAGCGGARVCECDLREGELEGDLAA